MIDIKDVKSEYVLRDNTEMAEPTENLISDWPILTKEEREGWYTTKLTRLSFNAEAVIEDAIERLCMDVGYEEMELMCMEAITPEQIQKLQDVLDDISNCSEYDVYHYDERINPKSEAER